MSDNTTTQSAAPATPPAATLIAARSVTYSGDAGALIAPSGRVVFAGADDAKVVFDLGAASDDHTVAAASTNAKNIKASPGLLVGVRVFNNAIYPIYVKFHNNAGVPTPGVGVVKTIGVQAGTQRDVLIPGGHYFSVGIAMSIVKGIADADATAVALSDGVVDVEYN
jgi:hypothetical protein